MSLVQKILHKRVFNIIDKEFFVKRVKRLLDKIVEGEEV